MDPEINDDYEDAQENIELANFNRARDAGDEEETTELLEKTIENVDQEKTTTFIDEVKTEDVKPKKKNEKLKKKIIPKPDLKKIEINEPNTANEKKKFFKKYLGQTINKTAGVYSQRLYKGFKILHEKGDLEEPTGASFNGKKILNLPDGGRAHYSEEKDLLSNISEFKNILNWAEEEHKDSPNFVVENTIQNEVSEEESIDIVGASTSKAGELADHLSNIVVKEGERLITQQNINISETELKGIVRTLFKNWGRIRSVGGVKLVKKNIKKLDEESANFRSKIIIEEGETKNKEREGVFNTLANISELRADEGRMSINEKPKGVLATTLLKMEAEKNAKELSKLNKIKKWFKENLLALGSIGFTIAGTIATVVAMAQHIANGGSEAINRFANSLINISKEVGGVVAAIGGIVGAVLSFLGTLLGWFATNLWVVVVLTTVYILNLVVD